jgi:hypothetical protein
VRPTHDSTEDAMNVDEENVEKTLRLWAGMTFSGVPVQSRRVWRCLAMTTRRDSLRKPSRDIRSRARFLRRRLITQEHSFPRSFPRGCYTTRATCRTW